MSITDRWKNDFKNEYFGEISVSEFLKHGGTSHNQQDHDPHKGGSIGKYPLAKKEIVKAPSEFTSRFDSKTLEKAQLLIPDTNVKIEDFIYNSYVYTDKETGTYSKVNNIKETGYKAVIVEGYIYDKTGNQIGNFNRSIYPDELIEHDSFRLHSVNDQKSGFGKRFYRNQEETYVTAGFKEIKLHAGDTVGGYAWARMGFDFVNDTALKSKQELLSDIYRDKFNSIIPYIPRHAWEIASYKAPNGSSIGKEIMLGSGWYASKKLSEDSEGYQIGQAYYNARSSKKSIMYENISPKNITKTIIFNDNNKIKSEIIDNSIINDNNQNTIKHGHHNQLDHNPHKGAIRSAPSSFRKQFKSVNYMNDQKKVIKKPFDFNMPDKDVDVLDYMHSAYNYYDRETNLISEVLEIWKTEDNRLNIQGTINDVDGDNVGVFSILLDSGGTIEFEELHVDTQSQGFGKRFYENLELTSENGGFKEIKLQANMEVGGYAWARMGFDFEEPSMAIQFGESFSKKYKSLYGQYAPVFPRHSWEIASYQGPDGRKIGKEFMLGSNWNGVKKLSSDNIGYQVGKAYYNADSNTKSHIEDLDSSLKHPGHSPQSIHGHRGGSGLGGGSYENRCREIINKPKSDYIDMSIQDGSTVSESDIHDKLSKIKEYNDWHRKLSVDEINAISEYTGSGYRPMNSFLRGKIDSVFGEGGWNKEISIMDNAISKSTIHQDMILRRGMIILTSVPKESTVYNQIASLKEGDIWFDKAFLSTGVGEGFQGARIQLELRVPLGTTGAYIQFDNLTGELENEAVLPREIPMYINNVISVEHPTYGNQLIVDATVLPKP